MENIKQYGTKFWRWTIGISIVSIILGIIYLSNALYFVDNYECGYVFDKQTGTIEICERDGYHLVVPFIEVLHTIDERPLQVCINANSRVLNCKLISFNREGLLQFIEWHGRGDYHNPSTNTSTNMDNSTEFSRIMLGYAYDESGTEYPFMDIDKEFGPNTSIDE